MTSETRVVTEPFLNIRLTRFYDGTTEQKLKNIRLKVDTIDAQQTTIINRPKFPRHDDKENCFRFKTRVIPGRKVTIDVYIESRKTNFIHQSRIEDLVRKADGVITEYRFTGNGKASMSIELIVPVDSNEHRLARRDLRIKKHYSHEFLPKYFTSMPAFCAECKKILWGFNTPGYRCQLCDLVVHENCIDQVPACGSVSQAPRSSLPTTPHHFSHEPNFLPAICDHDGKIISPLRAWKCSDCGMTVHSRCQSKVAHFCGTRRIAVKMYQLWKEKNNPIPIEMYTITEENSTAEILDRNMRCMREIYDKLANNGGEANVLRHLTEISHSICRQSSYYNSSAAFLHEFTFRAPLGRGMSGSVYWVERSKKNFALKAFRKHHILETNELDYVKAERDILVSCSNNQFIVQLHAVFHDPERVYFLLEFAPCGTLYRFLVQHGPHFTDVCIKWFSGQLACALIYLHSKLVIHRDLKPENVLLMQDARLKLADFGLCKQLHDASQLTRTFCGTSEYIPPEIYKRSNYSFPVDFWALGIMIYEMQTLKTPFYHDNDQDIEHHVVNNDFHRPDYFPADMESLVAGLLIKNPTDRFGADELRSHSFFTSPYSLDEIEHSRVKCPWRRVIPVYPPAEECSAEQPVHLSHIDAQAMCTTLTANKDVFRNFSFTFTDHCTT